MGQLGLGQWGWFGVWTLDSFHIIVIAAAERSLILTPLSPISNGRIKQKKLRNQQHSSFKYFIHHLSFSLQTKGPKAYSFLNNFLISTIFQFLYFPDSYPIQSHHSSMYIYEIFSQCLSINFYKFIPILPI